MSTHAEYRSRHARPLALITAIAMVMTVFVPTATAADPEDRVRQILEDASTGGTVGVYLREIGGATIADFNESFVFEPASTIKALIHFHAMRQVQDGAMIDGQVVTLARQIPWFQGPANYSNSPPPGTSCPDLTLPASDTLQNGLQQMMGPSDNRWTQAMRDFFTDAAIDDTRDDDFDMDDTALNHRIGCGALAIADPNQLTLVDAGKMYEAVATGYLDNTWRPQAFALMTQDNATFNGIIDAEAAGLGLSAASITSFKAQRQSANKAGSYGLSDGQYRSVAGWAQMPWKNSVTCATDIQEYVYGAFIHQADTIDATLSIRNAGAELFREELRAALESWSDCEADFEITSTTVVNPPAEFDVNTPTTLTVRVAMRNNGPADPASAVLSRTTTVPADCEISPTGAMTAVPDMPQGVLVVQDMDFTVECAQPSFHQFRFDSAIAPAIPAMVDPDPTNNTGVTQTVIPVIARADLAITDWDFSELDDAGIADLLVGQDFLFSTVKTLHNFGDTIANLYLDPVDAVVTKSLDVPDGIRGIVAIGVAEAPATVTIEKPGDPVQVLNNQPAGTVIEVDGEATITVEFAVASLVIGVDRVITEGFGIHCLAPGEHELTFENSIVAEDQHVVDPDPSNNDVQVVRVIECITPVQINIRPGNAHNFINPIANATVPVAILTTEAGEYGLPLAFDATTVDHASTTFGTVDTLNDGGGSTAWPDKDFIRDSFDLDETKDGDLDMVLLFSVDGSGIVDGTTEACVLGSYLDGGNVFTFLGCDVVVTKP